MNNVKLLASALCALSFGASVPAFAQGQTQGPAQGQTPARPATPRSRITTPLGRYPQEMLGAKAVVSNMQKSYDFYTKVIGLKPAKSAAETAPIPAAGPDNSKWPGEYGFNFTGEYSDTYFDILRPRPDSVLTPAITRQTTILFKVPDARAVTTRARELGYTVVREAPVAGPGEMAIGMLADPDGYQIEIVQAASYPKEK